MKFYDCATAPSPRRVRIFLAEKGIAVPMVQVNLREGEHLQPAFRKINPEATVPVLELDDGTILSDAIAICTYFEDIHPEPPLIGRTPQERAVTHAWNRRIERDGLSAAMEAFRNATPGLKGRAVPGPDDYDQIPALAERGRTRVGRFFTWMDAHLAAHEFVAGPRYTMADITTQITVEFAKWAKLPVPETCPHLARWFAAVSARPSAKA
ncbi:MAG: glutathione S-transferase [Hyphomonadaceae bacterium]|jgi:glutathione S-transferase|nr:glutathione S-transferase [Hyphomonadaceae bacterium]